MQKLIAKSVGWDTNRRRGLFMSETSHVLVETSKGLTFMAAIIRLELNIKNNKNVI